MNEVQLKHAQLLREAFNEYLIYVHEQPLMPNGNLLNYNFDFIDGRKWHILGDAMVRCDLRELTNLINRWNNSLSSWHAWSLVLEHHEEMEAWELRSEFLDSIVHECLLMPASIRDVITSVSTAAFHQVRLSIDRSHPDYLEGDPQKPGERPKVLTRRQKEKSLSHILDIWPNAINFLNSLREINTLDYVAETSNYRNLTAHTIGPNLEIGHTRTVTRSVVQAQAIKRLDDGNSDLQDIPGQLAVCYSFGEHRL